MYIYKGEREESAKQETARVRVRKRESERQTSARDKRKRARSRVHERECVRECVCTLNFVLTAEACMSVRERGKRVRDERERARENVCVCACVRECIVYMRMCACGYFGESTWTSSDMTQIEIDQRPMEIPKRD